MWPSLAGGDDHGLGQRAQAGVDRLLADGRRLAQAVQLVAEVLGTGVQAAMLDRQAVQLVARRRHADVLGQREERPGERHDDGREQDGDARRAAAGTNGRPRATAGDRGCLQLDAGTPRQDDGALPRSLVDGHSSVAQGVVQARRARVEEGKRSAIPAAPRSPVPASYSTGA